MKNGRSIIITESDFALLRMLRDQAHLAVVLENAEVVATRDVPPDVTLARTLRVMRVGLGAIERPPMSQFEVWCRWTRMQQNHDHRNPFYAHLRGAA